MLKNALMFAAAATVIAMFAPQLLAGYMPAPAPTPAPTAAAQAAAPVVETARADMHGERSIPADSGGQFSVNALIGGQSVPMLVDTGATMVVISAEVADRLGLSVESGRKWRVHTANGDTFATEALLPNIDLGTVYMSNVPALIADRSAGPVNLLGASFLKRLASVEQRNGVLVLRQ